MSYLEDYEQPDFYAEKLEFEDEGEAKPNQT